MATTQTTIYDKPSSHLLRRTLQADAIFDMLLGATLIVAAQPLAALTGLNIPSVLVEAGIVLFLFAGWVLWSATRNTINRRLAYTVAFLNSAWVVASVIMLLIVNSPLTIEGKWLIGMVAAITDALAILLFYGLRKTQ